MLKSEFKGDVMVFAKEYNGRTLYSISISKKKQDGTWLNGYKGVSFRKDVVVPNKTKINIIKAWEDFYINKDNQTVIGMFISEFEFQEEPKPVENISPNGFQMLEDDDPDSLPF